MKKTFLIRVITIVIVIDGINGTSDLLLKLILAVEPNFFGWLQGLNPRPPDKCAEGGGFEVF